MNRLGWIIFSILCVPVWSLHFLCWSEIWDGCHYLTEFKRGKSYGKIYNNGFLKHYMVEYTLNMNGHWIVSKKIKNFKQVMRFCHDLVSSLTFHIVIISTQTTEPIGTKPCRNDDLKILHRHSLFHLKLGCFWQFSKMTSPNNLLVNTCFMWCPPQILLISFRLNWQKTWLPCYVYFLFSIWIWNLDCHYTRICII